MDEATLQRTIEAVRGMADEDQDGEIAEPEEIAAWLRATEKVSAVNATRAMYLATQDAPGTVAGVRHAYQLSLAATMRTCLEAGVLSRAAVAEGLEAEFGWYGGARGIPGVVRQLSERGWSDAELAHAFAEGPGFSPSRLACEVFVEALHRDPAAIAALLSDPTEFTFSPPALVDAWEALGYRGGSLAALGEAAGWSLDQTVAALDEARGTDDEATTLSLLARDPATPPAYLEVLAGRALAGNLGLAIALRSNPAAQALVAQPPPVEQLGFASAGAGREHEHDGADLSL